MSTEREVMPPYLYHVWWTLIYIYIYIFFQLQNFELDTDKKDNEVDSGLDSTGNSDEQKQVASWN
jgi:hypothetical protein